MNSESAGSRGQMSGRWHAVIVQLNSAIDAVVAKGLALVVHRLNSVVWAVDRVDGGSGRGLVIAAAMARLTGYDLREQGIAIVSPIPSRLTDRLAPARTRVATSSPTSRHARASSHAMN